MACAQWKDRLAGHELGLLGAEERRQLEEHALGCQDCFDELEAGAVLAEAFRARRERHGAATGRRRWVWGLAAAAAVLLVGVLAVQLPRQLAPSSERGRVATPEMRPLSPLGAIERPGVFAWEPVEGALGYELRIHSADGALVWEAATSESRIELSAEARARLAADEEFSWLVRARLRDGRRLESPIATFRVKR